MPLIIIKLGQIRDVFQASKHGYWVARDNHPGEAYDRHLLPETMADSLTKNDSHSLQWLPKSFTSYNEHRRCFHGDKFI